MRKILRRELKEDTPKRLKRRARNMEKRLKKVSRHHITYTPEWIVPIFRGEHFAISMIQRITHVSRGFILSLEHELKRLKEGNVYDLDMPDPKKKKRWVYRRGLA